jgi:hypothetical protein
MTAQDADFSRAFFRISDWRLAIADWRLPNPGSGMLRILKSAIFNRQSEILKENNRRTFWISKH